MFEGVILLSSSVWRICRQIADKYHDGLSLFWLNNNTFCKKYSKMVKKYLDRLLNNHYTEIVVRE